MGRRSRGALLAVILSVAGSGLCRAQSEPLRVEPLKEPPPESVQAPIREALQETGIRVLDGSNKPFADIWLRKAIPATGKPGGPKGAVLFPVLSEGELLGVVKLAQEAHDYRDQAIAPGVYTLRYGLQPVNGDHLGVSTYRDYGLLLPADKDTKLEALAQKTLETRSAEAAGSNHPAVLMMVAPTSGQSAPGIAHDQENNLWGLILSLPLTVSGESGATPLPVQLIVVGAAPV